MKVVVWFFFIVGWTLLIAGYVQSYQQCPPSKIEYRYIPRSLLNEQLTTNTDSRDMYTNMQESYGRLNL